MVQPGPIRHVVIIVKENHTFYNYFGRFPGANGDASLVHASDPPKSDHPHDHATWLRRARVAAREQYFKSDIPAYWAYARQYVLCDNYFSDVAGPSTPNHLMLIAAASPVINNPNYRDPANLKPPFDLPSLPANLRAAGLTWRN
jgi:phospholipase C